MDRAALSTLLTEFLESDVSPGGLVEAMFEVKYGKDSPSNPWKVVATDRRVNLPCPCTPLAVPRVEMSAEELLQVFEMAGGNVKGASQALEEITNISLLRRQAAQS